MINNTLEIFKNFKRAAAILASCLFLLSCENSEEAIKALSKNRVAVEEAKDIKVLYSQGGKMKAILTAPIMNRFQTDSPYVEFPKSLYVEFMGDSLKVENHLFAKYGRFREAENKVLLRDSVRVYNIKKDTLKCKELWWDQAAQTFYTDKPVEIHQPDKIIFGNGLEAGQDFSWWVMKQVTGEVLVPQGGINNLSPVDSSSSKNTTPADSIRPLSPPY
jgi:LPS export ABC transporter protein LptC